VAVGVKDREVGFSLLVLPLRVNNGTEIDLQYCDCLRPDMEHDAM